MPVKFDTDIQADPIRRTLYSAASTVDIIANVDSETVKANMKNAVIEMLESVIDALKGKEAPALVNEDE